MLQNVIDELNEFSELEMKQMIELDIKTIEKSYRQKIQRSQVEVEQLKLELDTLETELALVSQINEYNSQIIKLNHEPLDKEDNIFHILSKNLNQVDILKMTILKEISDLESQVNLQNITLNNLKVEKSQLENKLTNFIDDMEIQDQLINDPSLMKINLFRNLGIHLESTKEKEDVVILSNSSGQNNIFKIDSKYSDYFISNYIWDKLG